MEEVTQRSFMTADTVTQGDVLKVKGHEDGTAISQELLHARNSSRRLTWIHALRRFNSV